MLRKKDRVESLLARQRAKHQDLPLAILGRRAPKPYESCEAADMRRCDEVRTKRQCARLWLRPTGESFTGEATTN